MRVRLATIGAVAAIILLSAPAHADGTVQIGEGAFNAGSGLIKFDQVSLGTTNPAFAILITVALVSLLIGYAFGYAVRAAMSRHRHRIASERRGWA